MKITCKQQDLSRGLTLVGHAVSSRSTLPILANILLSTDAGRLKLSATNLEIGIQCWIQSEVFEEGATTVPAKLMNELVSSLPPAPLDLSVGNEDHLLKVNSPRSSASIRGMDPVEFPGILTTEEGDKRILLEAKLLKEMIAQVAFAAADDISRPVLTGVHIEVGTEKMTFAAADAFRLSMREAPLSNDSAAFGNILVPARTLTELARILPSEGEVTMSISSNRAQVLFQTDQIALSSRLIEGTFPNFRQIIPKEHTTRAVVEVKEFVAAVRSVAPFARESSNITQVSMRNGENSADGSLTIESAADDVGNNVITIPAVIIGPDQQITLNVQYLAEVLAALSTQEVALEVTSPTRPGVVKPVGSQQYTYVVMPMSTNR